MDFINTKIEISLSAILVSLVVTFILVPFFRKIGDWMVKTLSHVSKSYRNFLIVEAAKNIYPQSDNLIGHILVIIFLSTSINLVMTGSVMTLLMSSILENKISFVEQNIEENLDHNRNIQNRLSYLINDSIENTSYLSKDSLLVLNYESSQRKNHLDSISKSLIIAKEDISQHEEKQLNIYKYTIYIICFFTFILIVKYSTQRYIQKLRSEFIRRTDKIAFNITQKKRNTFIYKWLTMENKQDYDNLINNIELEEEKISNM
ncbi:hypothetical protein [Bernardetia sp. MNP-M8]|uniref:hypothetical protein n=1 Tax=Bernardetia sp. MNP-M8 TaxID=3127470 RepID=UPI0030CDC974